MEASDTARHFRDLLSGSPHWTLAVSAAVFNSNFLAS